MGLGKSKEEAQGHGQGLEAAVRAWAPARTRRGEEPGGLWAEEGNPTQAVRGWLRLGVLATKYTASGGATSK